MRILAVGGGAVRIDRLKPFIGKKKYKMRHRETLRLARGQKRERQVSWMTRPFPTSLATTSFHLSSEQLSPERRQAHEARPKEQKRRRLRRGGGTLDLEANSVRIDHTCPASGGKTTTEVSEL